MPKRIIVTGGSGKAGQYIIRRLLKAGHEVLNLDCVPLPDPLSTEVTTLQVDLTNLSEVYSALTSQFYLTELRSELPDRIPGAIINLAAHSNDVCAERVARGFARRFGADVYVMRIGRLVAPDDEGLASMFESYVKEPERWKVHGWSYTDARDLGQMFARAVEVDMLGFQIFNATNNEITNLQRSSTEFLQRVCPDVPFTREMETREAPVSNRKIRELLGFEEEHSWPEYFQGGGSADKYE
ncbi:hypothetical protein FE257_001686 [Aspergillus nanangensis]|uniref:NAD-dependent epimerase/dehydratase domain-containing protein n=1 Tax=Aspergillus nanangensis TaxID=2582783 RepID=A0AAD4CDK0_ASPNN|nr:hypothetical protein FE257_001686 [Aspergillus nanangensis]